MADSIRMVWTGGREFAASLNHMTERVMAGTKAGVEQAAMALIRHAKQHATGPPRLASKGTQGSRPGEGPGVVTGRMRNSITVVKRGWVSQWGYAVDVAPTVIYSRRLELGFNGTDSRGRHYNQPPYPFMAPALRELMAGEAQRIISEAWAKSARV